MNWGEIKRAINSNFDIPLDQLIDSKDYGTRFEGKLPIANAVNTSSSDWTTIIEVVNGSGVAVVGVAGISTSATTETSARITVDGTVINHVDEEQDFGLIATTSGLFRVYGLGTDYGGWGTMSLFNRDSQIQPLIGFNSSFKFEVKSLNIRGLGVVIV